MSGTKIGVLFSVFDGDQKHFDRFTTELARLGYPFAVNFDHCCPDTKQLFQRHQNFLEGFENDDPKSFFDESHRQNALRILYRHRFDWMLSLDVDETLEKEAVAKIQQATKLGYDVVDFRVLDLWGDGQHYRTDGTFRSSHREKLFNLHCRSGTFEYYHPTIHAPKILNNDGNVKLLRYHDIHVFHWGIMDQLDVVEHTQRWDAIYTRKVGKNPYDFYPYINDPQTIPQVVEVPPELVP